MNFTPSSSIALRAVRTIQRAAGLELVGEFTDAAVSGEGRTLSIDYRWGIGDATRAQTSAADLVALAPDAIVANGTPALAAGQRATSRIPIVFVAVTDPVGAGYVQSLARPGGNITGFSTFEAEIGSKWLELLKELAPGLRRVAGILDPAFSGFAAVWREVENTADRFGMEVTTVAFRDGIAPAAVELGKEALPTDRLGVSNPQRRATP
jgi:putative tryptophan/tyrosine transport system substrate-binding protein